MIKHLKKSNEMSEFLETFVKIKIKIKKENLKILILKNVIH